MKSWNKQAKGGMLARVGRFSLLTLMIFNFSSPMALAALEDVKLWKRVDGKQVALKHLDERAERTKKAVEWLTADRIDFEKFLEGTKNESGAVAIAGFSSEPMELMEAVLKAAQSQISKKDGFNAYKTKLIEAAKAVTDEKWGKTSKNDYQKTALVSLIEKLFEKSDVDIAKLTPEDMLNALFTADIKTQLALEDKKEEEKKDAEKTQVADLINSLKTQLADFLKGMTSSDSTSRQTRAQEQSSTAATNTPAASGAPVVGNIGSAGNIGNTGEYDDRWIQAKAQEACDKLNQAKSFAANLVNPLKDTLAALVSDFQGFSRRPGIEQRQNQNEGNNFNLGDALARLTQDLDKNQSPATQPQAIVPPQPVASNRDRGNDTGPFNGDIPEKAPEAPAPPMDFGPQQAAISMQPLELKGETGVPVTMGQAELKQIRDVKREALSRTSPMERINSMLGAGVAALGGNSGVALSKAAKLLNQEVKRYSTAAANARAKADEITEALAALTKGTEADEAAVQRIEEAKATEQRLSNEIEAEKLKASQVGSDLQARQWLASLVANKTQQLNQVRNFIQTASTQLKKFTESLTKEKKQEALALQKRAELLNKEAQDLEKTRDEVKAESETVSDVVAQQRSLNDAYAATGAPSGGVSNIYSRMQPGGGVNPGVRTGGRGAAPQSGSSTGIRNSLGATK